MVIITTLYSTNLLINMNFMNGHIGAHTLIQFNEFIEYIEISHDICYVTDKTYI